MMGDPSIESQTTPFPSEAADEESRPLTRRQTEPRLDGGSRALRDAVQRAYQAYQADNAQFWRLFSLMTVVNGGLLVLVAYSADHMLWGTASIAGFLLCVLWAGMQFRFGWWAAWWDRKVAETEEAYFDTVEPRPELKVFADHIAKRSDAIGFSTRRTTGVLPCLLAAMWLLVLGYSAARLSGWPGFPEERIQETKAAGDPPSVEPVGQDQRPSGN